TPGIGAGGSTPAAGTAATRGTSRSPGQAGPAPARPTPRSPRHRGPSGPAAAGTRPPATSPRTRRTGAGAARVPRPGTAPPRASAPALQFFCDQVLHRRVVQRQLRVHPLELAVLRFQLLDPLQVRRLHAPVFGLPLVVGRHADAGLAADVLDRHPGIGLLEDRDDLGLGELRLLHGTSWLGKHARKFYFCGVCRSGKLTRPKSYTPSHAFGSTGSSSTSYCRRQKLVSATSTFRDN